MSSFKAFSPYVFSLYDESSLKKYLEDAILDEDYDCPKIHSIQLIKKTNTKNNLYHQLAFIEFECLDERLQHRILEHYEKGIWIHNEYEPQTQLLLLPLKERSPSRDLSTPRQKIRLLDSSPTPIDSQVSLNPSPSNPSPSSQPKSKWVSIVSSSTQDNDIKVSWIDTLSMDSLTVDYRMTPFLYLYFKTMETSSEGQQLFGEFIYYTLKSILPNTVQQHFNSFDVYGKITGMFLELDIKTLMEILENKQLLCDYLKYALRLLEKDH